MQRVAIFPPVDNPFMRQMVAGMAHGFEELGLTVHAGLRTLLPDDLTRFVRDFKPDLIIEINRSREMAMLDNSAVAHVCWIQDHWVAGRRRITDGLSGSDLYYTIVQPANLDITDLPPEYAGILLAGVDQRHFHNRPTEHKFDASFCGYIPPSLAMLRVPEIVLRNGTKSISAEELEHLLVTSNVINHASSSPADVLDAANLLIQQRVGGGYSFADFAREREGLSIHFQTELPRLRSRFWISSLTLGVTQSLALYGPQSWQAWSQFAPYYRGELVTAQELAAAHRNSRLSLHNGALSMHSRVLEGMACGSLMLVNSTPYDDQAGGIHTFFEPGIHYQEYHEENFSEVLAETLRNEPKLLAMRQNASAAIKQKHLWKHRAQQILNDLGTRQQVAVPVKLATARDDSPRQVRLKRSSPRILLVAPRVVRKYGEHYVFPIGLAYISACLKQASYEVECLNLNNCREDYLDSLAGAIERFDPDILGCGGLSVHFGIIQEVFRLARLLKPEIVTVAGGGIISSEPELMVSALDADAGVIGEGEITIVKLVEALVAGQGLHNVRGIAYKTAAGVAMRTPDAERVKNLDDLPWPDYSGFGIEEYLSVQRPMDDYFYHTSDNPRSLDIISSRSCPYDCSFCFHPLGRVYRERSLDSFFAELDHMIGHYKINRLAVLDELFAVKKERLQEFCQRIKPYGIKWMAQLRVDIVDEEILSLMHESGCQVISYGIESASDKVLAGMRKKTTIAQVEAALDLSYRHRVGIQGNLIFGDSTETVESLMESLAWWARNPQYTLWLTPIQHYPGTKIYRDAISCGAIADRLEFHKQGCPLVNSTEIGNDTYRLLMGEIEFLRKVSSYPGWLTDWQLHENADPVRGDTYDASCICPHCHHPDHHRGLTDDGYGRPLLRITCKTCQQRYDIPVLFRAVAPNPLAERLFQKAVEKYVTGDFIGTAHLLFFALSKEENHANANYLMAEIAFDQGDHKTAFTMLKKALMLDPLNGHYHTTYAEIAEKVLRADCSPLVEIYRAQARLLHKYKAMQPDLASLANPLNSTHTKKEERIHESV